MNRVDTKSAAPGVSDRMIAFVLLAATLLLYWQTAAFPFLDIDDPQFITANPHVRAGLAPSSIRWALTTTYINWQPLVFLSHMAVVSLFGLDPAAHHLVNALLHAANAAIFFFVLRRFSLPQWPAAAAAAVFALHPLRIESVAWVTERKDVLSALFWLLAMWAYVSYAESPGARRYAMVALYFVLGLMSKPMVVTLPVALLILDYWPLHRWPAVPAKKLILEKLPLLAGSAIIAAATIASQGEVGAVSTLDSLPLPFRLANVVCAYVVYLWKTVWPFKLAIIYPFPSKLPAVEAFLSAVLIAGISFWAWRERGRSPWWLAAWLWHLVVLSPVIGFIQVGPQPYADRYSYIPSFLPLAAAAVAAAAVLRRTVYVAVAAALSVALMVASWIHLENWRDDISLYRHAVAVAPGAWIVHVNLGVALREKRLFPEAIANFKRAAELHPAHPDPQLNWGIAYIVAGQPAEGIPHLRRAMELQPAAPALPYHLGRVMVALDRLDEAEALFRQALALRPAAALAVDIHMELGIVAYLRKNDAAALAAFQEALRFNPDHGPARKTAGFALGNMGRNREAVEQLEIYLKANPQDPDVAAAIAALRSAAK